MPWDLAPQLEPATAQDPARDYCQWPYDPPRPPGLGSLRGSALLYHSFAVAGVSERMLAFCDALRERPGAFATVWGVKFAGDRLSWEFYFYDYDRIRRGFDTRAFHAVAAPHLTVTAPTADDRPYFMFSVEIGPEHIDGGAPVDQLDLYFGSPGGTVSSGLCYGLSSRGLELRNTYYFFDARRDREDICSKLVANAQIPSRLLRLEDVVWPDIRQVQTIVCANKRWNDGLYFSRIPVDHLAYSLGRLGAPEALRTFAADNAERFGHLLFDVGYDYRLTSDGRVGYLKGSYYGLL